jgi:hypothetical protein
MDKSRHPRALWMHVIHHNPIIRLSTDSPLKYLGCQLTQQLTLLILRQLLEGLVHALPLDISQMPQSVPRRPSRRSTRHIRYDKPQRCARQRPSKSPEPAVRPSVPLLALREVVVKHIFKRLTELVVCKSATLWIWHAILLLPRRTRKPTPEPTWLRSPRYLVLRLVLVVGYIVWREGSWCWSRRACA